MFNHCQLIWWLFSWLTDIQLLSLGGLKRKVTLSDCNPTHEPTNTQKHNLLGRGNQQLHFHPSHLCWSTMLQGVRETSRVQTKKRAVCEQSLRSACLSAQIGSVCAGNATKLRCDGARGTGEWEEGKSEEDEMRRPLQRLYQANLIILLQPISCSTLAPCEPSSPLHSVSNDPN